MTLVMVGVKRINLKEMRGCCYKGWSDPETTPDLHIRYLFYLAQTYFHLSQFEDSIKWYKKRVEAGGMG